MAWHSIQRFDGAANCSDVLAAISRGVQGDHVRRFADGRSSRGLRCSIRSMVEASRSGITATLDKQDAIECDVLVLEADREASADGLVGFLRTQLQQAPGLCIVLLDDWIVDHVQAAREFVIEPAGTLHVEDELVNKDYRIYRLSTRPSAKIQSMKRRVPEHPDGLQRRTDHFKGRRGQ